MAMPARHPDLANMSGVACTYMGQEPIHSCSNIGRQVVDDADRTDGYQQHA